MLTSATFCMAFTSVQLHTQGQHSDISTQTELSITDQVQKNFDIILIKFSVGILWL